MAFAVNPGGNWPHFKISVISADAHPHGWMPIFLRLINCKLGEKRGREEWRADDGMFVDIARYLIREVL